MMMDYKILGKNGKLQMPSKMLESINANKGDLMRLTLLEDAILIEKIDVSKERPCRFTDCHGEQCAICDCATCGYEDCDKSFCIMTENFDDEVPHCQRGEQSCENCETMKLIRQLCADESHVHEIQAVFCLSANAR